MSDTNPIHQQSTPLISVQQVDIEGPGPGAAVAEGHDGLELGHVAGLGPGELALDVVPDGVLRVVVPEGPGPELVVSRLVHLGGTGLGDGEAADIIVPAQQLSIIL